MNFTYKYIKGTLAVLVGAFMLVLPSQMDAQQELGTHLMRELGQSNKSNPAFTGNNGLYIGFLSPYFNYSHTAGSIEDFIKDDNGNSVLDVTALIQKADADNLLMANFEMETFNAQMNFGRFSIGLNHAIKSNVWLQYSETLPKLFWEGNAQYVGQTIDFGPDQQSFAYNELGLALAYSAGNFRIGGRAKLLNGIGDVSTARTQARLSTDDDIYQLELETDYLINSSTFSNKLLFDTIGAIGIEYGLGELFQFENLFSSNVGFAFDLGIQYRLGDRLDLSASVVDVGQIEWTQKVTNFTSQGSLRYEGLEFSNILQDEELTFEGTLDTLEEVFDFKESSNSYTTKLAPKIYLSGLYQLNDRLRLGALFYHESFRGRNNSAVALSADYAIFSNVRLGAVYAMRNETFDNLGLNVNARFGPIRIFAMTDNILAAVRPYASQNTNARFGLAVELFNGDKDETVTTD